MDLNAFWGLAESPGVEASDRDRRLERSASPRACAVAVVRGMCPSAVDEAWDPGDLAEAAARVPRSGALFGKVA
ncbi:hypothetical protein SK571_39200 [Lentzea sp. BCCO 10_0798]|uniref:Uncharacterized protein n=1 Tax=Lentzea kristufekii TaxID=3095430 RepID=A0ABU4U518_9PSEU|nr:hypothetical protein [Lentzea sp. BCCO 10_0798]MDX8055438.1 hypothetical protein [Lentzea sp. BCCO 10_0798]